MRGCVQLQTNPAVVDMVQASIWFNGKIVPFEDATIHVLSHVIHYGSSVFEGIRTYNTDKGHAAFRLSAHIRRLMD